MGEIHRSSDEVKTNVEPLLARDSYLMVFDTIIEDSSDNLVLGRRWGRDRFAIDDGTAGKFLLTCPRRRFTERQ